MSGDVVAYVPVLHEGYRRFLERHGTGGRAFLIGPELYVDYRPLAKDIRCLDAELVARSIASWDICDEVSVLDRQSAATLAAEGSRLTLPAEDVSYRVVDEFFPRCPVFYDSTFLRWDKTRSVELRPPRVARTVDDEYLLRLIYAADLEARRGADWWRRVAAFVQFENGDVDVALNEHLPHPLSPYAVGDPRSNFSVGVNVEVSTAVHAEACLIARAARRGTPTEGATLYVTDFPCPPCAKLIAGAGIATLYYREGYAILDGNDVLEAARVEVVMVA